VGFCFQHGDWIRELARVGDLSWATGWGATANEVYLPLLGLEPLPFVQFPHWAATHTPRRRCSYRLTRPLDGGASMSTKCSNGRNTYGDEATERHEYGRVVSS
jgi:hypothetical protein